MSTVVAMIVDAGISNFKGISKCRINNLSRINLLIGKNNTCKSTILEALYYTLKEFTGNYLAEILARRTNVACSARELWYDYQTDETIKIDLDFQKAHIELNLSFDKQRRSANTNLTVTEAGAIGHSFAGAEYSSDFGSSRVITFGIDILEALSPDIRAMIKNYAQKCSFLDSSGRKDVRSTEELLGEMKLNGKAGRIWEKPIKCLWYGTDMGISP